MFIFYEQAGFQLKQSLCENRKREDVMNLLMSSLSVFFVEDNVQNLILRKQMTTHFSLSLQFP